MICCDFRFHIHDKLRGAVRLILLGPPGSGKGTQAQRVVDTLSVPHLSTGAMFRQAVAEGNEVGLQVEPYLKRGELVPDDFVTSVVVNRIDQDDCDSGFLLDGFPRTMGQAEALSQCLEKWSKKLNGVLLSRVSDGEIVNRLSGRRVCNKPDCQKVFHIKYDPPQQEGICDGCGNRLIQREDDHQETVRNRLRIYHEETIPLIEYYRQRLLLKEFDGTGTVEQVGQRLLALIQTK